MPKMSPSDRLVASLDGKYYKLSEVAELLGVSRMTVRRLMNEELVKAPSKVVWQGRMKVYLFTDEDLNELRQYFNNHVKVEDRHGAEGQ